MSTLTLVRHGQARPFEKDSDRLSELGERQAAALGVYWARTGAGFDEVYSGTLVRHVRTEQICAEAYLKAGGERWPEPCRTPGWNEYDADGILHRLVPSFAESSEPFRKLRAEFEALKGSPDRNRYFQRMFEMVMVEWLEGRLGQDGVEPFDAFQGRVSEALAGVTGGSGSRSVVVFTSGGPIGVCVRAALQAPARAFLDLNWRVKNGSLTEFVFSRDRLSLDAFNSITHLADPALVSFR